MRSHDSFEKGITAAVVLVWLFALLFALAFCGGFVFLLIEAAQWIGRH